MKKMMTLIALVFALSMFAQDLTVDNVFLKMESYMDTITDYQCYLYEHVWNGKKESENVWIYKFLKPHYIYMESEEGSRKGSKAFYDCVANKVVGRRGGILYPIKLTLDLTHSLVKNIRGATIAESDWPYKIDYWKKMVAYPAVTKSVSLKEWTNDDKTKKDIYYIKINNIPYDKFSLDSLTIYADTSGQIIGFRSYEKGSLAEDIFYKKVKINKGLVRDDLVCP